MISTSKNMQFYIYFIVCTTRTSTKRVNLTTTKNHIKGLYKNQAETIMITPAKILIKSPISVLNPIKFQAPTCALFPKSQHMIMRSFILKTFSSDKRFSLFKTTI